MEHHYFLILINKFSIKKSLPVVKLFNYIGTMQNFLAMNATEKVQFFLNLSIDGRVCGIRISKIMLKLKKKLNKQRYKKYIALNKNLNKKEILINALDKTRRDKTRQDKTFSGGR